MQVTEPDDVGEEVQVKTKKLTGKFKRDKEKDEFRIILSTYGGRAFIWRLLSQCGVYKTSFAGEAVNSTSFNEGKRQIGLWTIEEIFEANLKAFELMQSEAIERGDK